MGESNWTSYGSVQSYLTTELNALADDANKLGAAIDNSSAKDFYMDVEIYLASVDLSAQTNPTIHIWLVPRTDGTNFEDGGDAVTPARAPNKIVALRAVNGIQRIIARGLLQTPDQGKLLIGNRAGAALAATGNTVKYIVYSETTA